MSHRKILMVSACWLAVTTTKAAQASAQSSACRTSADTASLLVNRLKIAYASSDTAYLRTQGDPFAAPSAISLVTNSTTCKAAVSAYNKTHGLSGSSALKSAYVIALGTAGYVVVNPSETAGEYTLMFVYDAAWKFKRAVEG